LLFLNRGLNLLQPLVLTLRTWRNRFQFSLKADWVHSLKLTDILISKIKTVNGLNLA